MADARHTLTEGRTRNFSFALLQRVLDKDAPPPPLPTSTHHFKIDMEEGEPYNFSIQLLFCHYLFSQSGLFSSIVHPPPFAGAPVPTHVPIFLPPILQLRCFPHTTHLPTLSQTAFTCIFVESICFPHTTHHTRTLNSPPWPRVNNL